MQPDSERREEARRQLEKDIREVMAAPAGRRFVWMLINNMAGVFGGTFTGEALGGAFGEGRRAVGIALMQEVQRVSPASYVEMVREQLEAQARAAAENTPTL